MKQPICLTTSLLCHSHHAAADGLKALKN